MAKKSATQLKVKKDAGDFQKKNLPPIEETWEKVKQVYVTTLEVNVQLAKRIDNMLNLRDLAFKMLGEDYMWAMEEEQRMDLFRWMQETSIKAYSDMLKIAQGWTLEQFAMEDMPDWYEDLIPKPEDISSEVELLMAAIIFISVKPYGERMTMVHQQIQDEIKMREEA